MATENLEQVVGTSPATPAVAVEDTITASTYQQMLDVLEELITHTHIFYDDYSTACNCNCDCNCTRGIV